MDVLILFPVAVIKYPEKMNLREKGLIVLTFPAYNPYHRQVKVTELEATDHISSSVKSESSE